jgi:hypothetical protein
MVAARLIEESHKPIALLAAHRVTAHVKGLTAVTPPPDRFGAHDGAPLLLTERAKAREAEMKGFGQAVVGIIVKL